MPSRSITMDMRLLADDAASKARKLVGCETRGPGDQEAALHRIETMYGLPYWSMWAWLYRKPKEVGAAFYLRLNAALEDQAEKQRAKYESESRTAREFMGGNSLLVRAAAAIAGDNGNRGSDEIQD